MTPNTWKYLIKRDFGLDIDDQQPQQVYIRRLIYRLGLKYNQLANLYVSVVNDIRTNPHHDHKSQKDYYLNDIIINQQIALGALGLDTNTYDPMYADPKSQATSNLIDGIKVGNAFDKAFRVYAEDLDNATVFDVLDEMEFRVDDTIDFIKSNFYKSIDKTFVLFTNVSEKIEIMNILIHSVHQLTSAYMAALRSSSAQIEPIDTNSFLIKLVGTDFSL